MAPPPPPPADPLTVSRGLADAADFGAWLITPVLDQLLGMAPGTVRGWSTGHRPQARLRAGALQGWRDGLMEGETSVMRLTPPWRWSIRGPWPPDGSSRQEATPTDDAIRARADQLAKRRPWCSAEQNWTDACLELNSAFLLRWRPSLLRWLGASEKTGWDWMELSLKLSVPLTIALGGWLLGTLNSNRQNEIAQANQKDAVIREYIKEMKGMLLDKTVAKEAKQPGSEANGVARALTLTALTQLKGEGEGSEQRRTLVFQFLRDSNFPILAGSEKVQGANLAGYDLSEANLIGANLRRADLSGANLSGAKFKDTMCPDGKKTDTGCLIPPARQ